MAINRSWAMVLLIISAAYSLTETTITVTIPYTVQTFTALIQSANKVTSYSAHSCTPYGMIVTLIGVNNTTAVDLGSTKLIGASIDVIPRLVYTTTGDYNNVIVSPKVMCKGFYKTTFLVGTKYINITTPLTTVITEYIPTTLTLTFTTLTTRSNELGGTEILFITTSTLERSVLTRFNTTTINTTTTLTSTYMIKVSEESYPALVLTLNIPAVFNIDTLTPTAVVTIHELYKTLSTVTKLIETAYNTKAHLSWPVEVVLEVLSTEVLSTKSIATDSSSASTILHDSAVSGVPVPALLALIGGMLFSRRRNN